jgi:hypothetical protein
MPAGLGSRAGVLGPEVVRMVNAFSTKKCRGQAELLPATPAN